MKLFFDSETTGFPLWSEPSEGDNQPHLVQLSGLLIDGAGAEHEMMDFIIKPEGWSWTMEEEAARTHGITMEHANEFGVSEKWAVEQFVELAERATSRVAHNEPFDARMVRIGLKRYGMGQHADDVWRPMERECTQRMSTKIVNLPPSPKMKAKNMNRPKAPKLVEAYKFFFGEELDGAHDGLIDARGCARVYYEIKRREREGEA